MSLQKAEITLKALFIFAVTVVFVLKIFLRQVMGLLFKKSELLEITATY